MGVTLVATTLWAAEETGPAGILPAGTYLTSTTYPFFARFMTGSSVTMRLANCKILQKATRQ
ncbi:MAG: hypothetical protein ACYTG0_13935 [Planctomycetota bacterium]|jgi:hypothetical protein